MSVILAELGKQVAGRWAALLLLPGACYVIAVVVAVLLGHGDALDPRPLAAWLDRVAAAPASGRFGTVLIAAMGFTAASAAAGVAASAAALLVEWTWGAAGDEPVLRRFARRRGRRWDRAQAEVDAALREFAEGGGAPRAAERLRAAIARRDAVCPVPARRPTWVGDRLYAVDERVHDSYHLDLSAAWPRLWLMLPDAARAELAEARTGCDSAARLTGWGLLYLPLAVLWWPAAPIAAGVLLAARHRSRQAVAVQADLVEAAVDLYGRDLAGQLGIDCPDRLTPETGAATTAVLRKDRTNPAL
ncbi:hypothetical protein ACFPM3_06025 [Streptomyces coeruleoprunus]|uniref:Vegetative cell wall protein gp1 n=1 Tax=Streptomyces coeruleoprunus TaxID=285563 RepID=A0ABV9XAD6_9ACTN